MVPVSYWVIQGLGVEGGSAIRVAFGTSLLVILPTAASGAWAHTRRRSIRWKAALALGASGLGGGVLGASLATHVSARMLEIGFGTLVLGVAIWLGLGALPRLAREGKPLRSNPWLLAACGLPVGVITGLTGLGGGVLIVPVLMLAFNFPAHMAVGTSIASIVFTSVGGVIGYVVNGIGVPGLPPYSLGYVNLPIWASLAATSIPLAQLGSRLTHVLPGKQLRYIFIAFMVYAGLRMLGLL